MIARVLGVAVVATFVGAVVGRIIRGGQVDIELADWNPDELLAQPNCARCGRPADGLAYIGEWRYCHPDDSTKPDCYTLQSRADWCDQ